MNRRGFLAALLSSPIAAAGIPKAIAAIAAPDPVYQYVEQQFMYGSELGEIIRRSFVPKLIAQSYATSPLLKQLMRNSDGR